MEPMPWLVHNIEHLYAREVDVQTDRNILNLTLVSGYFQAQDNCFCVSGIHIQDISVVRYFGTLNPDLIAM